MNFTARRLSPTILLCAAMHLLVFAACSRSEAIDIIRVEDRIPEESRQRFSQALRHYSMESRMIDRLKTTEKLGRDTTWAVADSEWPVFVTMISTDEVHGLKNCRTIEPDMIAVPRIHEGHVIFELVPVASGSALYSTKPSGRVKAAR
jgi:hypothetical protein